MDQSKQRAIQFLEKEIKTYTALALFFSKKGSKESVKVEDKKILISPTFYRVRMKEAKRILSELRKPIKALAFKSTTTNGWWVA